MVFLIYPYFHKYGQGINKREVFVLIWGGLRGALSLTLALMVGIEKDLDERY